MHYFIFCVDSVLVTVTFERCKARALASTAAMVCQGQGATNIDTRWISQMIHPVLLKRCNRVSSMGGVERYSSNRIAQCF